MLGELFFCYVLVEYYNVGLQFIYYVIKCVVVNVNGDIGNVVFVYIIGVLVVGGGRGKYDRKVVLIKSL